MEVCPLKELSRLLHFTQSGSPLSQGLKRGQVTLLYAFLLHAACCVQSVSRQSFSQDKRVPLLVQVLDLGKLHQVTAQVHRAV